MIPDWLSHPHADYVLAAYGLALAMLGGLAVLTWLARRESEKALKTMQKRNTKKL